ncbi:MAG TPA: zinc finger domain-containing protein, partial [Candidatus Omnitrophota bacterium]|nr:zinc finger domain-containing protein [Candidatus Omnitrophota bacterium]
DNGYELRLHDTRKFARFYTGPGTEERLKALGPEPLDKDFKPADLRRVLTGGNRTLKPLLLDQAVIAGLGNIYVDEALWEARLNPQMPASGLTPAAVRRLHQAVRSVLEKSISNFGTSLGTGLNNFQGVSRRRGENRNFLNVYGRTGQACPRCGTAIRQITVAQRSTHVCPQCQKS